MKPYPLFFLVMIIATYAHANDTSAGTPQSSDPKVVNKEFVRYAVRGDFADIKAFLVSAIEERGIKISSVLHISDMLSRTGEAVGDKTSLYKQAEAIEFCSATLSRELMQADPHNILFCPFSILIYEPAGSHGTTYLAYRRPFYHLEGKNELSQRKIDQLLQDIIRDAAQ
jgi:uncharacterized protein (DUF302 family)